MDINTKIDIARQSLAAALENGYTDGYRDLGHAWAEDIRPHDSELADQLAAL
ncbi:hypothetical protein SEA_THERESITA_34 [Microbacterium phage Theresita]|nr:hypothetical protein SEA_THERESITA_34 [Microbacterium phage Theresita]